MTPIWAVVLAGGSGTRFWPLSRRQRPKQLLPLLPGDSPRPMLTVTIERVATLVGPDRFFVVAPREHETPIREATGLDPARILTEPRPANTSPAILFGALAVAARAPAAVVAVLPSDHAISPAEALRDAIRRAADLAQGKDAIVTFGIRPDSPNTGYGYIERGEEIEAGCFGVASFREKPDARTAEDYLRSGRFAWNSGMFVFKAERLIAAYRRHHPGCAGAMEAVLRRLRTGAPPGDDLARLYDALEPTSIDYAIMEKERDLLVLDAPFAWSDVGAPSALGSLWPADGAGNGCASGIPVFLDASGNLVLSQDPRKVVALLGVHDLVVIDTPDALLVCPKSRDQEIRRVVEHLKSLGLGDRL